VAATVATALAATVAALAPDVGVHLKPLETEAIAISLVLFIGINYGWPLFMEPVRPPGEANQ
jgi:hypothetical protein